MTLATARSAPSPNRALKNLFFGLSVIAVVAGVVPPLSIEARRYVFAEALQFSLFALAMPALAALGDPLALLAGRRMRSMAIARRGSARRRTGLVSVVGRLLLFIIAVIVWRTPPAVDGLARMPLLEIAEIATFVVAGGALWLELLPSKRLPARLTSAQRIVPATVAMWMFWIVAYLVGFSRASWYPAIHHLGSPIGVVADQEVSTGVLWATATTAFVPVIFANLMRFLRGDEEADDELGQIVAAQGPQS